MNSIDGNWFKKHEVDEVLDEIKDYSIDGSWLKKHEVDEIVDEIKDYPTTQILKKVKKGFLMDFIGYNDSLTSIAAELNARNRSLKGFEAMSSLEISQIQNEARRFLDSALKAFESESLKYFELDKIENEITKRQLKSSVEENLLFCIQTYQNNIKYYEDIINIDPESLKQSTALYVAALDLVAKRKKVEELISELKAEFDVRIDDETLEGKKHR